MPNAYDDLQPTSPEMQAMQSGASGQHVNAYADFAIPEPKEAKTPETPSVMSQLGRGVGLTSRALIQGVAGLPLMADDAMEAGYRLATDPATRAATWEQAKHPSQWLQQANNMPSQQFSQALDPYLPKPETVPEKISSFGLSLEGGALAPQIPISAGAPANFMTPAQQQAQRLATSLQRSKDAGFVVPPSTTNPTLINRTLETVGGKEATQNQARVINQQARNTAAATDLGLKPEVFTPEAVAAVKREAGQGFESARSIPRVQTDTQFGADLDKVLKETRGANVDFPGASNPDVENVVNTYRQGSFSGDSAVSAIKLLRSKSSDAYRQGNSELGMAYKGVSGALESQLERGAQQAGGPYTDLVSALRQARQTYAKASTIEDAMSPAGDVSGPKLAAAWKRGEPLSGGTLLAAEHAANYPKANLPANSSNISHLNLYGMMAIGGEAGEKLGGLKGAALGAALPLARGGARSYLLSGMGQAGAIPGTSSKAAALAKALAKPSVMAAAYNSGSTE